MRGSRGFVLTCMERRTRGDFVRASAMWKAIVAGTAALAIAGTSLVYAQQRGGRDGMMMQGSQLNAEDLRAFGEARLGALRAGLQLTPEQEKNWPAFEQAARDYGKVRMDRFAALRDDERRPGRAPASARHSHDGGRRGLEEIGRRHGPTLQEP